MPWQTSHSETEKHPFDVYNFEITRIAGEITNWKAQRGMGIKMGRLLRKCLQVWQLLSYDWSIAVMWLGFRESKYNIVSPPGLETRSWGFFADVSAVYNDRWLQKHSGINQNVNMLQNTIKIITWRVCSKDWKEKEGRERGKQMWKEEHCIILFVMSCGCNYLHTSTSMPH